MDSDAIPDSFPKTIPCPAEVRALCDWNARHQYPISGYFELCAHDDETLRCWFGTDRAIDDLAQFGSGGDGSLYCVWRAADGSFPVVHLGSEGDAIYVLAPTALDFLRLLAIGYGEIGFADLASPPSEEDRAESVNPSFQRWVNETYGIEIPSLGDEIVQLNSAKHAKLQAWIDQRCG